MSVFDDSTGAPGDWPDDEARALVATSKLEQSLLKALVRPVVVERSTRRLAALDAAGHDALIEEIRALESLWMVRGAGVL